MPNLKAYVGRTFSLRKNKSLHVSDKNGRYSSKRYCIREDEFGPAVLVFDETNTTVCVMNKHSKLVWIAKYYLHKEILETRDPETSRDDSIKSCINELTEILKTVTENKQQQFLAVQLETVIGKLQTCLNTNANSKTH